MSEKPENAESEPISREYLLERLAREWRLEERPFRSAVPVIGPLIAGFRRAWNSISTQWYVRPLVAQQQAYNHLLGSQVSALMQGMEELYRSIGNLLERVAVLQTQLAEREAAIARLTDEAELHGRLLAEREAAIARLTDEAELHGRLLAEREAAIRGLVEQAQSLGRAAGDRELSIAALAEQCARLEFRLLALQGLLETPDTNTEKTD